jgi:hypothetical protein
MGIYLLIALSSLIVIFAIWFFLPIPSNSFTVKALDTMDFWNLQNGSKLAYYHLKSIKYEAKASVVYLHGGSGGCLCETIKQTYKEIANSGFDVFFMIRLVLVNLTSRKIPQIILYEDILMILMRCLMR